MARVRKGQNAVEFLIMFGVVLFVFSLLFLFLSQGYSSLLQEGEVLTKESIATDLRSIIEFTHRSVAGSRYDFEFDSIIPHGYSASIIGGQDIRINDSSGEFILFLPERFQINGTLDPNCNQEHQLYRSPDYGVFLCCGACADPLNVTERPVECRFGNSLLWEECDDDENPLNQLSALRFHCPEESLYANLTINQSGQITTFTDLTRQLRFKDTLFFRKDFSPSLPNVAANMTFVCEGFDYSLFYFALGLHTGQTTVWATYDDAYHDGRAKRYTIIGPGVVRDEHTRLYWTDKRGLQNHSQAVETCDGLDLAGESDWRVPSILELVSAINFENLSNSFPGWFFPGENSSERTLWSSTSDPTISEDSYVLRHVFSPITLLEDSARSFQTVCVRGTEYPALQTGNKQFEELGDFVLDVDTSLYWQKGFSSALWAPALESCENSNLGGFEDWRLPTVLEAYTLVDFTEDSRQHSALSWPTTSGFWSTSTSRPLGEARYAIIYNRTSASNIGRIWGLGEGIPSPRPYRCVRS
ncbi:MAG: DUF1566 domain-containing protein [Candidatus Woesearchaeota archaeon]